MINPLILTILKRKVAAGIVNVDDIKNEEYKEVILNEN